MLIIIDAATFKVTMVDSVNPSSPIYYNAGNPPPTPSNQLFYAMTNLWALFSTYNNGQYGVNTPVNSPHYLGMLTSAIKAVMAQFGNQPPNQNTDPTGYSIFHDLTTPFISAGGNYYSLASISQEPTAAALQDLSTDWTTTNLPTDIQNLSNDVVSWFPAHYQYAGAPPEPPVQAPAGLAAEFATLLSDLTTLQNNPHNSADALPVMNDIIKLQNMLSAAPNLDGYGLFLQSYLNAPVSSDGQTTLVSLATNTNNPVAFMDAILGTPQTGTNLAAEIQGWVSGLMQLEFLNIGRF